MGCHVILGVAAAHPVQRCCKVVLALGGAGDEAGPLIDIGVVGIGEFFFGLGNERSGVNGVEDLLRIEGYADDVDGAEPVLDFLFRAFADVYQKFGTEELILLVLVEGAEIPGLAVLVYPGELLRDETAQGGDSLLPVQDFVAVFAHLGEIDEAQRVAASDALDDIDFLFAAVFCIEIVALEFRLDGQSPGEPVQALAFVFVVLESLADVADGPVLI